MTSKTKANKKKTDTPGTTLDSDTADDNMAAIAKLLEEHKAALSAEFKSAITPLEAKLDFVQTKVADHGNRISSLEANANEVSDKLEVLEAKCAAIEANYNKLKAKTIDLESRCRRNNIRIVGLPESIEGTQPTAFFSGLLKEVLGDEILPKAPELDRAHRALVAKPAPGSRPRAVIVRVHHYQIKAAIIQEARRRRGSLCYQGKPFAIYEDYCPEVIEQRTPYREVMSRLYQEGYKPALLYPARLRILTKDGGKKFFTSVEDATAFLET